MQSQRRSGASRLYAIDAKIRGKPPHERQQARQAEAKPLIDDLERWLRGMLEKLSRKSDTSAAILYALSLSNCARLFWKQSRDCVSVALLRARCQQGAYERLQWKLRPRLDRTMTVEYNRQ